MAKGIEPAWMFKPPSRTAPKNHQSCQRFLPAVTRSICEGQEANRYMVGDDRIIKRWSNVVCSPLGAVEKKDVNPADEIRLIHDLSFPPGESTNSCCDKTCAPAIHNMYVDVIADRVVGLLYLYPTFVIKVLKRDVKTAFRNLMSGASNVHWMAAPPFGWSGSPLFYSAFGRAITWLVEYNSPSFVSDSTDTEPFFGFEWVDDHVLIACEVGDRLALAEASLRHAMLAILGPRGINDKTFF
ncbi:hypothetical protein PHMEG_0009326 [Phytophthora megakarya]|uniref:Reverse transcriptase n=1 Tax=Phytophthora megakarya TaxID=4795 RepID=A0A225WGI2_9STRA|nr:hypothetical protein PHMEG_0009326 [Phytophthora megakarya]